MEKKDNNDQHHKIVFRYINSSSEGDPERIPASIVFLRTIYINAISEKKLRQATVLWMDSNANTLR